MKTLLILALLSIQPGGLAPTIEGETKCPPATLVRLKATNVSPTAGILWDVFPFDAKVDRATTDPHLFEFVAPPGTYHVQLTVSDLVDGRTVFSRSRVTVTIGEPKPPAPTPPGPQPPLPDDPLARKLKALWDQDTSRTKVPDLLLLIELYTQGAELAQKDTITTLAQLAQSVNRTGLALVPADRLTSLRKEVAAHLAKEFGDEEGPMTPELRDKATRTYQRLAQTLESIGGNS